jgi:uncharacterized membrane protein YfcA
MDSKLYFTIAAIVAILYGIGFVLIPANLTILYGGPAEPNVVLNARFFGSALLAWGVILWFARDFQDWAAVRGVLIGSVIGLVIGGIVNISATVQGLLNVLSWSSTAIYVLLLLGALYVLYTGSRQPAFTSSR